MIRDILLVGAGSCLGGILRYLVSLLVHSAKGGFPWSTFLVNIIGCLIIGLLWGLTNRQTNASSLLNLFLIVGFCGGFTTFSTFSKENLVLLQSGNYFVFALYSLGSISIGLAAVALGYAMSK